VEASTLLKSPLLTIRENHVCSKLMELRLPLLGERDGWRLHYEQRHDSNGWRAIRLQKPADATNPAEIRSRIYKFGWHPDKRCFSKVHDIAEVSNRWPLIHNWVRYTLLVWDWSNDPHRSS
jgi:hypothetical protein